MLYISAGKLLKITREANVKIQIITVIIYCLFNYGNHHQWRFRGGRGRAPHSPALQTQVYKRKRKRSDSVLWQKPLHQQKCQKGKVTTQTTPQKSSITQRLRTDLGRSVGVTTATQLVLHMHIILKGTRLHNLTYNLLIVMEKSQKFPKIFHQLLSPKLFLSDFSWLYSHGIIELFSHIFLFYP